MFKDKPVCKIDSETGEFQIFSADFMPLNLFLENFHGTIAEKISNINAFDHWCADRVLSLDRRYAKKILNELGLSQAQTTSEKAKVSRAYHSLSLQDAYWTKSEKENVTWKEINLFTNSFSEALVPVALHGGSATIRNKKWDQISQELSTNGTYAKAWSRKDGCIILYKADDINGDETLRETNASRILECFDVPCVSYYLTEHDGKRVSACACMTNEDLSIVPFRHFKAWCEHYGKDAIEEVKKIDFEGYHRMNIMTYLIGNADNHDGNWGFYRDNHTGDLIGLHPLFDFNCAFENYREKDGGWCLPEDVFSYDSENREEYSFEHTKTLKEAALEGIAEVDTQQRYPVTEDMFLSAEDYQIFQSRCDELGIDLIKAKHKNLEQNLKNIHHGVQYSDREIKKEKKIEKERD